MKKKITTVLILSLLITATVLPVADALKNPVLKNKELLNACNVHPLRVENGEILDQDLDEQSRGYTVMFLWGSDYERGYAYGQLLGDYIVQACNVD